MHTKLDIYVFILVLNKQQFVRQELWWQVARSNLPSFSIIYPLTSGQQNLSRKTNDNLLRKDSKGIVFKPCFEEENTIRCPKEKEQTMIYTGN